MNTSPQIDNCMANVLYLFYDRYNVNKNILLLLFLFTGAGSTDSDVSPAHIIL
jgi:hypothetical protein